MPPRLHPVKAEHELDESLAVFKNELLRAGLLSPDKDWYDIKYTENNEFKLLESLERECRYVFDNQYDSMGDGKEYGDGPQVNLPHLKQFPTVFPILHIEGETIPDGQNGLKPGHSLLVYTGEVLKDIFTAHNLLPETITEESHRKFLEFLSSKLGISVSEVTKSFYLSCYGYYGRFLRTGTDHTRLIESLVQSHPGYQPTTGKLAIDNSESSIKWTPGPAFDDSIESSDDGTSGDTWGWG